VPFDDPLIQQILSQSGGIVTGLGQGFLAGADPQGMAALANAQSQQASARLQALQIQQELAKEQMRQQGAALMGPALAELLAGTETPSGVLASDSFRADPVAAFTALGTEGINMLMTQIQKERDFGLDQKVFGPGRLLLRAGRVVIERPDGSLDLVREVKAGDTKQYQLPGGAVVDSPFPGTYISEPATGELANLPTNARRISPVQQIEQGEPGAFTGLTKSQTGKQVESLRSAAESARTTISLTDELIDRIQQRPELLSVSGSLSSLVTGVEAQVFGLLRLAGTASNAKEAQDLVTSFVEANSEEIDGIVARMKTTAIDRGVIESMVQTLAYSVAAQREGGKLSASDVQSALRTIGQSASPEAFVAVLEDLQRRTVEGFEGKLQIRGRGIPTEELEALRAAVPSPRSRGRRPPRGVPAGSVATDKTFEGKPVWRAPDGSEWVE